MSKTPLKRHPGLQALSREHHQGLILALNVDKGIKKEVEFNRIAKYISVHYEEVLKPHFDFEENKVFTFLPEENKLRKIALKQHNEINEIVQNLNVLKDCKRFADRLRKHIRFEERELFELIQTHVAPEELDQLNGVWEENMSCMYWEDAFWK
jgi:hemerythrin-like domain-containing protein